MEPTLTASSTPRIWRPLKRVPLHITGGTLAYPPLHPSELRQWSLYPKASVAGRCGSSDTSGISKFFYFTRSYILRYYIIVTENFIFAFFYTFLFQEPSVVSSIAFRITMFGKELGNISTQVTAHDFFRERSEVTNQNFWYFLTPLPPHALPFRNILKNIM